MTVSDIENKNIDIDELNSLLMKTIDELEVRFNEGKTESIDEKAKLLVAVCAKLWIEKNSWMQMYYEITGRYGKHLDEINKKLANMLPRGYGGEKE